MLSRTYRLTKVDGIDIRALELSNHNLPVSFFLLVLPRLFWSKKGKNLEPDFRSLSNLKYCLLQQDDSL